jgi:hypothetical protein
MRRVLIIATVVGLILVSFAIALRKGARNSSATVKGSSTAPRAMDRSWTGPLDQVPKGDLISLLDSSPVQAAFRGIPTNSYLGHPTLQPYAEQVVLTMANFANQAFRV